jgi:WD40 repeat protein
MILFPLLFSLVQPAEAPCEDYVVKTRWSGVDPLSGTVEGFDLFNQAGRKLWSVEVGGPAGLEPLDEGYALMIRALAPEGLKTALVFIDPSGKICSSCEAAFFSGLEISSDRRSVLINSKQGISLFSLKGELAREYPGVFSKMALDYSGRHIAMTSADSLFIFSGMEIMAAVRLSSPYVRDICFSENGERVAVLTSSSIELWNTNAGQKVVDLSSLDASPRLVSVSKSGKEILVVLRNNHAIELLSTDFDDLSIRLSTEPLSSPDEAVIEIMPTNEGWLIHLTSGWYRFLQGEE